MPREIEAKYKVASFAGVEKALNKAGAVFLGTHSQSDQFFDTPENSLRRSDKGLRLRIVKPVGLATGAKTAVSRTGLC